MSADTHKSNNSFQVMRLLFSGIAAVLVLFVSPHSHALEVITHPLNETNQLSVSSLRSIFSMRMTQWPDGTPIRVFVLGDKNPLHSQFSKQVLGIFPHQLRRAWNRQIYSGIGQAPTKVQSQLEMYDMVESTPGAIGYLAEDKEDDDVRIIEIE